jgi:hypothetical protein
MSTATGEANGRPQRLQQGARRGRSEARQERHIGIRAAVSSNSPQSRQGAGKNTEMTAPHTSCRHARSVCKPPSRGG